jgi:hypothetical protein
MFISVMLLMVGEKEELHLGNVDSIALCRGKYDFDGW